MKNLFLLAVTAITVLTSSCKDGDKGSATRVNIRMTDAPGAYDAIILSVKEIRVLTSEGESTLPVSANFDILKFRLGKDTLLASQDIPSGRLNEVRIVLNDTGNKVIINGIAYNLTTPSAQSSGLKLKINEDLTSGIEYTLKLDFDAAKSIVQTGNGKYILKPVIRAIPNTVSGALTGIISPAVSNSKVYAIAGFDTVGAVADATGKFFFPGMQAGTYKVNVVPQSPYLPKTIENVQIVTGSVKDMGTIAVTQ
jgi:hypothetical protein